MKSWKKWGVLCLIDHVINVDYKFNTCTSTCKEQHTLLYWLNDSNDILFVDPPTSEDIQELSNAKNLIAHLYSTMNVEQHQIEQEKELLQKLEHLKTELAPMEEVQMRLYWDTLYHRSFIHILFQRTVL